MLKCRDVPDHATDYMEGALDRRSWIQMRLHLMICSLCRAYMDQLGKTRRFLSRRVVPAPDEATIDSLARAVDAGR